MQQALEIMFSAMGEFRLGKSSTVFHKVARDLGHIVLTNKKEQEHQFESVILIFKPDLLQTTRFIRSAASATKTFFQNLPTIVMVLSEVYKERVLNHENTKAKEILLKLQKLRDPKFLLLLTGLAQIMETYCEVSLEGQHAKHFPTQVWQSVAKNREKIQVLAENWTWGSKVPFFL